MSDVQILVSDLAEKICDNLCKYCDNDYTRNGGKTCEDYCEHRNNGDCELRELLKAVGL